MKSVQALLSLMLLAAASSSLWSQSSSLQFEVASIKPVEKPTEGGTGIVRVLPGGRLSATEALIRTLIQRAYGVRRYQILGGPGWIDSARYNIEATAAPTDAISPVDVSRMLQSLLEDRFQLKTHREVRDLSVYEMTAARTGLKLPPSKEAGCFTPAPGAAPLPPPGPGLSPTPICGVANVNITPAGGRIYGGKVSMPGLAATLSNMLGRTVIDKTGFTGTFDLDVAFLPDQALDGLVGLGGLPPGDDNGVTIFTALQEALGLKLDSGKGPVEVLIIDGVERPTEN